MNEKRDRTQQLAKAHKYLVERANEIDNPALKCWCLEIVHSVDFQTCTASRHQHQAYDGGLMVHTAEVLEIAVGIAATRCLQLDMDVVTTAVIFHDIGKIYDYVKKDDGTYEYTKHQDLIRHLPRSYAIFMSRTDVSLTEEKRLQVAHAILAHHGRKEWGSPTEPKTPEAYAVHCADWISANATMDYWE